MKLEGDVKSGVEHYKKALLYNSQYADAMYNLGVAYGEMLKFDKVMDLSLALFPFSFVFLLVFCRAGMLKFVLSGKSL